MSIFRKRHSIVATPLAQNLLWFFGLNNRSPQNNQTSSAATAEKAAPPVSKPVSNIVTLTILSSEIRPMRRSEFTYATAQAGDEREVVVAFGNTHKTMKGKILPGATLKVNAIRNPTNRILTIIGLAA